MRRRAMCVSSLWNVRAAKLLPGEVSEWLMVPLSKSGRRKPRGFESRPLRGRRNSDATIAETLFTRQGPPGLRPAPHRAGALGDLRVEGFGRCRAAGGLRF